MATKICFKCNKKKDLDDFYKHSQMRDGHLNKCKECNKKDVKDNYVIKAESPEWMENEWKRGREKYHHGMGILEGYRELPTKDKRTIFFLAGRLRRLYKKYKLTDG
jgi:hypothetical protein